MILEDLYLVITNRKKYPEKNSYVTSLLNKGEDRVLQKFGEEAVELMIAAKGQSKKRVIEEAADLFFMTLLVLNVKGVLLEEIFRELERRRR